MRRLAADASEMARKTHIENVAISSFSNPNWPMIPPRMSTAGVEESMLESVCLCVWLEHDKHERPELAAREQGGCGIAWREQALDSRNIRAPPVTARTLAHICHSILPLSIACVLKDARGAKDRKCELSDWMANVSTFCCCPG